jgi:hypothetical protein
MCPSPRQSRQARGCLALALGLALLAAAAPPALGANKLPHWLRPPYRHYTLTYDASSTYKGSAVNSFPDPEFGERCEYAESVAERDGSAHVHIVYGFVFGHFEAHREGHRVDYIVSTHRLSKLTVSGGATWSDREQAPRGCDPGPFDSLYESVYGQLPAGSCHTQAGFDGPPFLDIEGHHHLRRLKADLLVQLEGSRETCREVGLGGGMETDFRPLHEPLPAGGTIHYTVGGVLAGRTFHGHVALNPRGAHGEEGTVPEAPGVPQSIWSSQVGFQGTLTMAPVRHRRARYSPRRGHGPGPKAYLRAAILVHNTFANGISDEFAGPSSTWALDLEQCRAVEDSGGEARAPAEESLRETAAGGKRVAETYKPFNADLPRWVRQFKSLRPRLSRAGKRTLARALKRLEAAHTLHEREFYDLGGVWTQLGVVNCDEAQALEQDAAATGARAWTKEFMALNELAQLLHLKRPPVEYPVSPYVREPAPERRARPRHIRSQPGAERRRYTDGGEVAPA